MLNGRYGSKTFRKTFLSYTIVLIIPIIVFGALNMHRNALEEQKELYRKHESDARRIADNMDSKLRELKNVGEFFSEETWVKKLMPDEKVFYREFDLFKDLEIRRVLQNAVSGPGVLSFGAVIYPDNHQVMSPWGIYSIDSFFSSVVSLDGETLQTLRRSMSEYHYFKLMDPVDMKLWDRDMKVIPVLQSLEVVNHPRAVLVLFIDSTYLSSFIQRISGAGPVSVLVSNRGLQIYYNQAENTGENARKTQVFVLPSQICEWEYKISYSYENFNGFKYMLGSLLGIMISAMIGTALAFLLAKISYRPLGILLHKLSSAVGYDHLKNDIASVSEYNFIEKSFDHLLKENRSLQQTIKDYESAAKSNLLLRLLKGYFTDDRQIDWLNKFGLHYNDEMYFCTMLIHFHEHSLSDIADVRNIEIITLLVAEKVMNPYRIEYQLFEVTDADKAIILSSDQPFDVDGLIHNIASEIAEEINKNGIQTEVLYGTVEKGLIGISKSYYQANENLQYTLFSRRSLRTAKDAVHTDVDYYYPTDWEVQLINTLKIGNLDKSVHILDEIKTENENRHLSEHCTMKLVSLIMETMLRVLHELNIDAGIYARQFTSRMETGNIEALWNFVYETATLICERINYSNTLSAMELGSKLLHYVNENYTNADMSLKMLAEVFHMSVSAVSKMFKEVTGINFYDYLCRLRMELAKELLREKKCGVDDIAHMVGYENVYSFKRAFVRYEGIKPDEYVMALRI